MSLCVVDGIKMAARGIITKGIEGEERGRVDRRGAGGVQSGEEKKSTRRISRLSRSGNGGRIMEDRKSIKFVGANQVGAII